MEQVSANDRQFDRSGGRPSKSLVQFPITRDERTGKPIYKSQGGIPLNAAAQIGGTAHQELMFGIVALDGAVEKISVPRIQRQPFAKIGITRREAQPFKNVVSQGKLAAVCLRIEIVQKKN